MCLPDLRFFMLVCLRSEDLSYTSDHPLHHVNLAVMLKPNGRVFLFSFVKSEYSKTATSGASPDFASARYACNFAVACKGTLARRPYRCRHGGYEFSRRAP